MKKQSIRSLKTWRYVPVLLLALLAISIALNLFLYFEWVSSSSMPVTGTLIERSIEFGMGRVMVLVSNPRGGLRFAGRFQFNVTVSITLWDPFGSGAYVFPFKLYESAAHDLYPDTPVAEKTVTVQKDRSTLGVGTCIDLTATTPEAPGTYVYKVVIGRGEYDYEVEFPIMID